MKSKFRFGKPVDGNFDHAINKETNGLKQEASLLKFGKAMRRFTVLCRLFIGISEADQ